MKHLIVNADDFGGARCLNRGIVECHERGVLTSTSLMVNGPAVAEAVSLSRSHPELAIGLHWDVVGEDEHYFDDRNPRLVRGEFLAQLERFRELIGAEPTHIDSHRHVHRSPWVLEQLIEIVGPLGIPMRFDGQVHFIGGFYAQWEWGVTELAHVSIEAFQRIMREEVGEGWTELACHPGYRSPELHSPYESEREAELRTLTDPLARATIDELGIALESYQTLARLQGRMP